MTLVVLKRIVTFLFSYTPLAFLWMAGWLTVIPLLRRRARQNLPGKAREIGLSFEPARSLKELGVFSGTIDGRSVTVLPDRGTLSVGFNQRRLVEISTIKPVIRPRDAIVDVQSPDRLFNMIYKTCRLSREDEKRVLHNCALADHLKGFYLKWVWQIQQVTIRNDGIQCIFNYGQPFYRYIPSNAMAGALRDMLFLAGQIEGCVSEYR
jgi:hypothetical protein